MNTFCEEIKIKMRAKFSLGDISATEADQAWLLACIDFAASQGRVDKMDAACDRMQAEIDRLEKYSHEIKNLRDMEAKHD
jgi:hypothetical protein